jgi:hypothetical protein
MSTMWTITAGPFKFSYDGTEYSSDFDLLSEYFPRDSFRREDGKQVTVSRDVPASMFWAAQHYAQIEFPDTYEMEYEGDQMPSLPITAMDRLAKKERTGATNIYEYLKDRMSDET